ncbi:MAG: type II toxin-antitoxin system YafQ family toxin [Ignavibacteria bacterium]|jgi:mRNA interferase YafQ|nr:type II toxin-antitoxin system YafQ family toxin [Ignavibacteria bacterium]
MLYSIDPTVKYIKDLQLSRKRQLPESKLDELIELLASSDEPLPAKYNDHKLHGVYEGYRECHIQPD